MKKKIKRELDNWYHNTSYEILFYWEQDKTYFIVIKRYVEEVKETWLEFVRIFPSLRMEKEYHLSIDLKVVL